MSLSFPTHSTFSFRDQHGWLQGEKGLTFFLFPQ
jgi:hypothetical protein